MLFNCQFAMSLSTLFIAHDPKQKLKSSEEHTEINMNKHYTKAYHA